MFTRGYIIHEDYGRIVSLDQAVRKGVPISASITTPMCALPPVVKPSEIPWLSDKNGDTIPTTSNHKRDMMWIYVDILGLAEVSTIKHW